MNNNNKIEQVILSGVFYLGFFLLLETYLHDNDTY